MIVPTYERMSRAGDRTRVLMLIDRVTDKAGGAERFAVGLAGALPRDRFEVTMCVTRELDGELPRQLIEAGVRIFSLDRGDDFRPQAFLRLVRYLRRERVDVLHAHMFGSNVWGTLLGRLCRVPAIVAHEQTWSYEGNALRRELDRHLIGRGASAFVAVSSADAERMATIERVPREKIVTIPNAYIPRPPGPPGDLRGELSLASGVPLIVTGAILRPQKALHVLLDAFGLVAQRVPQAHLAIAGMGPCEQELRERAAASSAADRIHFLGLRTDMDAVLKAGDIATMSSDFEGTPLFALECMAHRTPLVSTDVGGIRDILDEGTSVLLAPRRDPRALADQLERALLDADLRESLADAAHARLSELTIEQIAARFESLYDRLLAAEPRTARASAPVAEARSG